MPVKPGLRKRIEIDLSDRVLNSTRWKQRAICSYFTCLQDEQGVCSVSLEVVVRSYSDDKGKYGESLHLRGVPDRAVVIEANNQTLVDFATGAILLVRSGENDIQWEQATAAFAQETMLQGDYFEWLREQAPLVIGELIRHHIRQADAIGRFA
jgi:hypothetical protein